MTTRIMAVKLAKEKTSGLGQKIPENEFIAWVLISVFRSFHEHWDFLRIPTAVFVLLLNTKI